jgi:hypothetical protein
MPDTVSTAVLAGGPRQYAVRLTNLSDGTGETNVAKVDLSTLLLANGQAPTKTAVKEIQWTMQGFSSVRLLWDRDTDVLIDALANNGYRDYETIGYLADSGTGGTGDILLTTVGAVNGATYDITLVLILT